MGDNGKREFSLDEILEEQRKKREEKAQLSDEKNQTVKPAAEKPTEPKTAEDRSAKVSRPATTERRVHEEANGGRPAVNTFTSAAPLRKGGEGHPEPMDEEQSMKDDRASVYKEGGKYDERRVDTELNGPAFEPEQKYSEASSKKKKKKRWGLFGRKNKVPDFDENEETVYGLQLKPIDEYREGYNPETGEFSLNEDGYAALFDDSKRTIDDEVEKNFQRLQRERRSRVAKAVESAGMDEQEIEEELGFVAPMPVSSFSADPYTRQHGIDIEGGRRDEKSIPDFQKAQLDSMQQNNQTMEIKLNILNDTMELQKVLLNPDAPVSDESIRRILGDEPPEDKTAPEKIGMGHTNTEAVQTPERKTAYAGNKAPEKQPKKDLRQEARRDAQQDPAGEKRAAKPATRPAARPAAGSAAKSAAKPSAPANPPAASHKAAKPEAEPKAAAEVVEKAAAEKPIVKPIVLASETKEDKAGTPAAIPTAVPVDKHHASRQVSTVQMKDEGKSVAEKAEMPMDTAVLPAALEREQIEQERAGEKPQPQASEQPAPQKAERIISRDKAEVIHQVSSIYEYRDRGIPTHVVKTDLLQNAILNESEEMQQKTAIFGKANAKETEEAPTQYIEIKRPNRTQATAEFEDFDTRGIDLPVAEDAHDGQESSEDYVSPSDAKPISSELRGDMNDLTLRIMITGICTLVLAVINIIFKGMFSSSVGGDIGAQPYVYVILTLVFLGIAMGVCFRTILNGLRALFRFMANSDSAVAIAGVGVVVQTVSALFFKDKLVSGDIHLYAAVMIAALCINAIGKLTMLRRIHSNFRFITSKEKKYSIETIQAHDTKGFSSEVMKDNAVIAYHAKTGFLKRFLEYSYIPDPSEAASQTLAPIGLISSLVLCLVCLLLSADLAMAISVLAASLLACVALANMLSINLPVSRLTKRVRRGGAMVVGYEAIERAGNINKVMVDADDLFPKGTVVLNGIKTYGGRNRVEDAILAASSLVNRIGGPLTGVFEQVINENEEALPKVEKYVYEDDCGISGWVDGKRVFIGNRKLILNHNIQSRALDDEMQYSIGEKQVVYIAVDADVVAMMIVTYSADRRKKNELQRLEDNGISVLLRTTDANITVQLISKLFGINKGSVMIMESEDASKFERISAEEIPRCDAIMATKGRMESMMTVISACVHAKQEINLVVALQVAAVILGFVLVAFLGCFGAISRLTALGLFLFELVWMAVILLIPKIRSR